MRKLTNILLIAIALLIGACEGPVGPIGPPGEDGYNFLGTTFEFTGNFTSLNDYQLVFNFLDNGFDPYYSDVVLAYVLWDYDGYDYWRPLPQTEYFDTGAILKYDYDFKADYDNDRLVDMSVFLGGDVVFSSLPSAYTQNQTFRIVVVPSDFMSMANVDASDLNSILNSPNLQLNSFEAIDLGTATDSSIELK